jgi:uncharacterized membrane protein (UPF0127 family)
MAFRPNIPLLILAATAATAVVILASLEIGTEDDPSRTPQYLPISAKAEIGTETLLLEVAQTPEERALGLMFRPPLPDNQGMLFPSGQPRPVQMWMKNVPVPLDMVFIHEGRVIGVAEQVPPCPEMPCPIYGPFEHPVDHVLELRAGRIAELDLKLGDPIRIRRDPL